MLTDSYWQKRRARESKGKPQGGKPMDPELRARIAEQYPIIDADDQELFEKMSRDD